MKHNSQALFVLLLAEMIACWGCQIKSATNSPGSNGFNSQEEQVELNALIRPFKIGDFERQSRAGDSTEPLRWIDIGTSPTKVVAISPDCRQAVVGSNTQTIVYDLISRKVLHEWDQLFVEAMYNPDGQFLVTVGRNQFSLWDTQSFQSKVQVAGEPLSWRDSRYNSNDVRVAVDRTAARIVVNNCRQRFDGALPEGLLIYSTRDGILERSIEFPHECHAEFLLDGTRLLCTRGGPGDKIEFVLFDVTTGSKLAELSQIGQRLVISPDGSSFAAAQCATANQLTGSGWDGPARITIYDAASGQPKRTFEYPISARSFTFSPDNRRLLVAFDVREEGSVRSGSRGHLIEWDIESGAELFRATDANKPFATVAYSPSGNRRFATTEAPNGLDDDVSRWLQGWQVDSGESLKIEPYEVNYNGNEKLIFFPRGQVYVDAVKPFAVKNVLNGETVLELPEFRERALDAEFMPGDDKFTVNGLLTDVSSGKQRSWNANNNTHSTFIDEGRTLFSLCSSYLQIVDVLSGKIRWRLDLSRNGSDVAISRDGKWIASASGSILLIDVSQPYQPIVIPSGASAVAFHPDGTRILAATKNEIREYEVFSGRLLPTVWSTPGRTLDLSYSKNGESVVACGVIGHHELAEPVDKTDKGWAVILNVTSGKTVDLVGHAGPVACAVFSEADELVATGSLDNTVRIWNTTGKPLKAFTAHRGPVADVAFNTEGTLLLSAALDGAALWDLSTVVEPVRPAHIVAQTFRVIENLALHSDQMFNGMLPSVDANMTESGLFDQPSDLRKLGPTSDIRVTKQSWNLVHLGSKKRVYQDLWYSYPRWIDLANTEKQIMVDGKTDRTPRFQKLPDTFRLTDTSFDQSIAVIVSRKEKQIALMQADGKVAHNSDYFFGGNHIVERTFNERHVRLYDPLSLELVRTIDCHLPVWFVQVTADGERMLVGHFYTKKTILLSCWSVESGELLWRRAGTASGTGIFSPQGKYYLCGSPTQWTLWEIESGDILSVISLDRPFLYQALEAAVFSAQDDALFFGSLDGPQLWAEGR
jgi:WD40 repeat protein